jgi:hypothetical protein
MKTKFLTIETIDGITEHAIIEHADGSFTSMRKSTYDEMIANQENGTIS